MNESIGSTSMLWNLGLGISIAVFIGLILFGGIDRISIFVPIRL